MNTILIGFFSFFSNSEVKKINGCTTEPYIRPFADYFGYIISDAACCIEHVKILQSIQSGIIKSYPGPGFASFAHYYKDLARIYEYDTGNYLMEIHPDQLIRIVSAFYMLLTEKKESFMEVEILSFTPYFEETPIPDTVKALPLIKLTDPIPLPPLN